MRECHQNPTEPQGGSGQFYCDTTTTKILLQGLSMSLNSREYLLPSKNFQSSSLNQSVIKSIPQNPGNCTQTILSKTHCSPELFRQVFLYSISETFVNFSYTVLKKNHVKLLPQNCNLILYNLPGDYKLLVIIS